jgi:hypothetical protein
MRDHVINTKKAHADLTTGASLRMLMRDSNRAHINHNNSNRQRSCNNNHNNQRSHNNGAQHLVTTTHLQTLHKWQRYCAVQWQCNKRKRHNNQRNKCNNNNKR